MTVVMMETPNIDAKPIVCPGCGNHDPEKMRLYLIDLSSERYHFTDMNDGMPTFEWGKSVYAETSPDHEPEMECESCSIQWEISWEDFDIG